jgi:hypothetical protein
MFGPLEVSGFVPPNNVCLTAAQAAGDLDDGDNTDLRDRTQVQRTGKQTRPDKLQ